MEQNLKEIKTLPGDFSFPVSLSDVKTENVASSDLSYLAVSTSLPKLNETCKKENDSEKFCQGLKYHDKESYVLQRDHKIDFDFTNEIEDLPPRHKKKVVSAYEKLRAYEIYLLNKKSYVSSIPPPPGFFDHKTDRDSTCLVSKSTKNLNNSFSNMPKVKEAQEHFYNHMLTESQSDKFSSNEHIYNTSKPKYANNSCENMHQENHSQIKMKTQRFESHEKSTNSCDTFNTLVPVDNTMQSTHHKHKCLLKNRETGPDVDHIRDGSENHKAHKKEFGLTEKSEISIERRERNNHYFHANHVYKPSTQYSRRNEKLDIKNSEDYENSKLKVSRDTNFQSKNDSRSNNHYGTQKSESKYSIGETNQKSKQYTPKESKHGESYHSFGCEDTNLSFAIENNSDNAKKESSHYDSGTISNRSNLANKSTKQTSENIYLRKTYSDRECYRSNHSLNEKFEGKCLNFYQNPDTNRGIPCRKRHSRDLSHTSISALSDKNFKSKCNYEQQSTYSDQKDENFYSLSASQKTRPSKQGILSSDFSQIFRDIDRVKAREETKIDAKRMLRVKDEGFFLHISVFEPSNSLEMWEIFFKRNLKMENFEVSKCCDFTESIILSFNNIKNARLAHFLLYKLKHKTKDSSKRLIKSLSSIKRHLIKPCMCENDVIEHCDKYFDEFAAKYIRIQKAKINAVIGELNSLQTSKFNTVKEEKYLSLKDTFDNLKAMEIVFQNCLKKTKDAAEKLKKVEVDGSMSDFMKLKLNFCKECNSFERGLPIYSQKDVILNAIRNFSVTVIVAETGSGKSTQLTQYLWQTYFVDYGSIICTQPRKIAAISITKFVSTQIGSSVGKEVGYDVGIEKKFGDSTKIIYMTDYALLRKCLRNRNLKGISFVIIDEAHERTLYTDLLLGLLKQCLACRPDLRVIITSATINPSVFINYFNLPDSAVINVPGRAHPVEVIWSEHNMSGRNTYVSECVKTAVRVHKREPIGDILVFLTSPAEIDEAILLFKEMCAKERMPELLSLHGKSDVKDQMLVFETNTNGKRRIIFATNAAETSLTIPGIKYVIDSGMAKEMIFYPEKNKSCLMPSLINKSSAEQRKGRAGRTQPGVCYRLYSKKDYESMPERALPELLKTDLLNALLKVYEFGIKPSSFDFVESPSKEAIARSIESLEVLELIENNELTELGKQVVQLSIEPRLAKFILLGVESGMGHEAVIIAALVSEAGRIFLKFDDNKEKSDRKKKNFCQKNGDLCTFLEIYKRWLEVSRTDRFNWCVSNYVSSKALNSASKTVKDILFTLRQDLGIKVSSRYNNLSFKENFETILFRSFAENLCIYSGHPSLGYQSPHFKESLFIHPSSSLKYLRIEPPKFLVYTVFMETTRNFILDVTPLKEETVKKAYLKGYYVLSINNLRQLQIPPITLGPFGEKILSRYILGKDSSLNNLKYLLKKLVKEKKFEIDVIIEKGLLLVYVEEKFHDKVSKFIHDVVADAQKEISMDTDVIKIDEGLSYFCISTGGLIHDIMMPGEFREIIIEQVVKSLLRELESMLKKCGPIQTFEINTLKTNKHSINVTYLTVADAQNALRNLYKSNIKGIQIRNVVTEPVNKSSKSAYKLKFTWPRLLGKGTGSIFFSSAEDCMMVSGKLSTKSLYVDNNRICVTPSQNELSLNLKNIPPSANERLLQEKISEALPQFLRKLVKRVEINRMDTFAVAESDIIKIKDQLFQSLSRFTPPSKVMVDVMYPIATSRNYEAFAYFKCAEDGKTAYQQLNDTLKVNNIPVSILEVLQSQVKCKEYVYDFLQRDIHNVIKQQKGSIKIKKLSDSFEDQVTIEFSCRSIENHYIIIREILRLVHGRKMECHGIRNYFHLFTDSGKKVLDRIQARTKTLIECDTEKKIVFIYGHSEKCFRAEAEIHSYIETAKLLKTKMYDLKSSDIPPGFLKELYFRYGWDLYGLIKKFDLKAANIDTEFGKLTIEGEVLKIKKVEDHLEEICSKLHAKKTNEGDIGFGICAICLDFMKFDYYRLENCGHSFCKSCLLLQLESKIIPVACAQVKCGKPFFLIDINRILSFGDKNLKQEFHNAALQHYVRTHFGKVSYCPTPECHSVYRVSSKYDVSFHCLGCSNDICTHCQTFSHKGMSCEVYQNSKVDED